MYQAIILLQTEICELRDGRSNPVPSELASYGLRPKEIVKIEAENKPDLMIKLKSKLEEFKK